MPGSVAQLPVVLLGSAVPFSMLLLGSAVLLAMMLLGPAVWIVMVVASLVHLLVGMVRKELLATVAAVRVKSPASPHKWLRAQMRSALGA